MLKYEITPNGKKPESEWADLWLVLGIIGFGFAVAGASYLLEKIIDHTKSIKKSEQSSKTDCISKQDTTISFADSLKYGRTR
ncbi:MAG: hypothetical protein J6S80_03995 [Alphaproteobacteria bacterium]|nr:hypothetical protein [Alphaproteobacteria bacterium]